MPDVATIRAHVEATCPGVEVLQDEGSLFFVHPSSANKIPFATVTVSDKYDPGSDLARRGLFRLNLGIGPAEYRARFGALPPFPKDGGLVRTGHDFRAVDTLMPHPVYAAMGWACIVAPSAASWERELKALLALAWSLQAA